MATTTVSAPSAVDASTEQPLFTCLSCSIAFHTAEEQRIHYRSDHHRYNMKRRVAALPPVSVAVFNQKVLERRAETAIMSSAKGSACDVCSKTYTTENAYRSHINSKRHKENELKAAARPRRLATEEPALQGESSEAPIAVPVPADVAMSEQRTGDDASEEDVNRTIDEKIAAARSRLSTTTCLFCPHSSLSLDANLTHMSRTHSFFIPDAEYLVDIAGLLTYLGEKIAVGNVCIFCNEKSREFRTLDAVRKHMLDKGHCKIGYDSEKDRLEVSDFYDFSSSYPAGEEKKKKKRAVTIADDNASDEEWDDVEDDGESADEVVDEDAVMASASESSEDESVPDNELAYGDSHFELVLPSGARVGHRSMRRYYAQSFRGSRASKNDDPNSGAAVVRRLLEDKNSALVPRKGGFGAFGEGTEIVKARNRGEARNAGRHVREFRDQKRRQDFKTKVGFIANHQKHFRDPLLQ